MNYIAIFGAPRSGTSWLGQIFNSSPNVAYRFQPLFSYTFKGRLSNISSAKEINNFYKNLLNTNDSFILQEKNVSGKEMLSFSKKEITHLVWKEVRYHYVIENLLKSSSTKIIGIIRHPCSVIWSWMNAPKEYNPSWNILDEWQYAQSKNQNKKEEYYGYQKWKVLALEFMYYEKTYPNMFITIKYEDLNSQTEKIIKKLFDFSELQWQQQTESFLIDTKTMETNDPYGVFKINKSNKEWILKLPLEIENEILNDPDFVKINEHFKWEI